jgi:hypothetical protein
VVLDVLEGNGSDHDDLQAVGVSFLVSWSTW